MPYIDEEKLAELYKEADQENKSSIYFQQLYFKYKARLKHLLVYIYGFYSAVFLFMAILGYAIYISTGEPIEEEFPAEQELLQKIKQLELENSILGGQTTDVQKVLSDSIVYTVQFIASEKEGVMLFSENSLNFRAHPLQGFNANSLGNFSTKEEAEAFRKELLNPGLMDLWVTSYRSGERILLND